MRQGKQEEEAEAEADTDAEAEVQMQTEVVNKKSRKRKTGRVTGTAIGRFRIIEKVRMCNLHVPGVCHSNC